jgi:hypothetical protein
MQHIPVACRVDAADVVPFPQTPCITEFCALWQAKKGAITVAVKCLHISDIAEREVRKVTISLVRLSSVISNYSSREDTQRPLCGK